MARGVGGAYIHRLVCKATRLTNGIPHGSILSWVFHIGGSMKIIELASAIAKKEGHKSQARIGDIRELLGIIADMSYESPDPIRAIVQLGISRSKRRKKNAPKS